MALTADLYNIKSSGAYTYIIDKSQIDIRMENRVMPLVVGFSDNGPRRMPVVITSKSQFYRYFGNESKKEYDKGNYFHKMATDLLENGRFIYAMNLAPINDSLLEMFNTDNGFTPNYGYECDENEAKFAKIYNSGKPTHIFVFENTTNNKMKVNGYDLTVQEYYQSPSLNPSGLPIPEEIKDPEKHRVYEYYRNVYAFDGYFDDYYLKSLYDSGYNTIIKKGTKITVGDISFGSLKDADTSKPEYQKIIFGKTPNIDPVTPDPWKLENIDIDVYFEDTREVEGVQKTDLYSFNATKICFSEKAAIKLCSESSILKKLRGKAARVGDLLELDADEVGTLVVYYKDKDGNEQPAVPSKVYIVNGDLNDAIMYASCSVQYSNNSVSEPFDSKITFSNEGFYIAPNTTSTKIQYSIIGSDRVQIKGGRYSTGIRIKMPYGCILNVDNDGTETKLTNSTDSLALGSYSKLEMSTGNECYIYPNLSSTYITADGIVVEPNTGDADEAVLAVKSTDMKMLLSEIGTVDTMQQKSQTDEWVYIKLNKENKHTFTFGDALEPFIIENTANGGAADVKAAIEYDEDNATGCKGITTVPVYCTPLGKTVALKVKIGDASSTIISANGIEWSKFKSEVLGVTDGDTTPAGEWVTNIKAEIATIKWNVAIANGREIAQTYYLTGGEATINALAQIDGSGFISKYSGFAIPAFIDAMGVNQDIKNAFNQDVFLHNSLVGTTFIRNTDTQSNVLCDWVESDSFSPLYDGNVIANALIDSDVARETAFKLLFGTDSENSTAEMRSIIPNVINAPSCLHTGKAHKIGYGTGGYDYDYNCLDPETTKKADKILFKSLTDNPYLTYRYLVDTIIHNGSYLNGAERCNKWVGTAITLETNVEKLRALVAHHNLFKVAEKYQKAAALVNAPYPIKTSDDTIYNWTKDMLPSDLDGNWRGTYTTAYKMMNYDTTNTSLISCQGHIYPSAGRECELCFQKMEQRFVFTPVAGPNFGVITDTYNVTPAETFGKDDRDVLEPLGLNVLVYKENVGTYINSNQTAKQRVISALSKFHVSELLIQMTIDIQKMMLQLQWEMNTPQIRDYLKMKVDNYCEAIKNNKGLYTYYNICDRSNNTDEVIDNEMIVLDTGVEIARAMGKMVNRITVYKTGGIALSGLA